MKAYIMTSNLTQAAVVAEKFTETEGHPRLFLRAASLYSALRDWDSCLRTLERGMSAFPDSVDLKQAYQEASEKKSAANHPGAVSAKDPGELSLV